MTKEEAEKILSLPMKANDSGAENVRGYLQALLLTLMREEQGFSGKRPFGNSGWQYDLYEPLAGAGLVPGEEEDGRLYVGREHRATAENIICEAIAFL